MFLNPLGWYAFLALIPLILLYLIRPRPKKKMIPSLMFFAREKGFMQHSIFLRRLLSNLLLLIHILLISLLALALTDPFIERPAISASDNTVVIIDTSASMQTMDGSRSRFEKAQSLAKQLFKGKVTLIAASNVPTILVEKGSSGDARRALSALLPVDTNTNIGDAMLAAGDIIGGDQGKVYVISDFKSNVGPDPIAAKRALLARDFDVELVDVISKAKNAGIIDMKLDRSTTEVTVMNFDDEPVGVSLNVGTQSDLVNAIVFPDAVETLSFDTPQGITKVLLRPEDDFMTDNNLVISAPDTSQMRTLLITNQPSNNIRTALDAAHDVSLDVAEPPVVPSFDYDIIVLHKFNKELMLPGFYDDIGRKVREGASVVITAQPDLKEIPYTILPFEVGNLVEDSASVEFESASFTKHIVSRHTLPRHFDIPTVNGTAVIATSEPGNSAVLTISKLDLGNVVYYGFFDEGTFKSSPDYPIFWNMLLRHLMQREDLEQFNVKTGRTVAVFEQTIVTPSGSFDGSRVLFDRIGEYSFDGRKLSANLLSAEESDVSGDPTDISDQQSDLFIEAGDDVEQQRMEPWIVAAILILVILEIAFLKYRGDL